MSTMNPTSASSPKHRQDIVNEKFIDGPPDLIIEVISKSNRTHDTVVKFQHYAQYGVGEYWLVDPRDNEISTWRLQDNEYVLLGVCPTEIRHEGNTGARLDF